MWKGREKRQEKVSEEKRKDLYTFSDLMQVKKYLLVKSESAKKSSDL